MEFNLTSFGQFKDLYRGQKAVVFGTGPTVNTFCVDDHFSNAVFVGVNDIPTKCIKITKI